MFLGFPSVKSKLYELAGDWTHESCGIQSPAFLKAHLAPGEFLLQIIRQRAVSFSRVKRFEVDCAMAFSSGLTRSLDKQHAS